MYIYILVILLVAILVYIFSTRSSGNNTTSISKLQPPRESGHNFGNNVGQEIPRVIHQTASSSDIPLGMYKAIQTWINLNPEYTYKFYDNGDCRNYIASHFSGNVLAAYDKLIPGAYKADLFRYCVLYKEGGVYADCGMVALVPLRQIITTRDKFITPIDGGYTGGLYNAFICSVAGHPILEKVIEIVTGRVLSGEYGYRDLYPTGPIALGDAYIAYTGLGEIVRIKDGQTRLLLRNTEKGEHIGYIYDENGKKLVKTKYPSYFREKKRWSGDKGYSVLWKQRKIYKS